MRTIIRALLFLVIATPLQAEQLTIYNGGFAWIEEDIQFELKKGDNFTSRNVSGQTETTSILLELDNSAQAFVQEQLFQSSAASQNELLKRYHGKKLRFLTTQGDKQEILEGTLLRADANYGFIVETKRGVQFSLPGQPLFEQLPADMSLVPNVRWTISSRQQGRAKAKLMYTTYGMSWQALYILYVDSKDSQGSLRGFVEVSNQTAISYPRQTVKLVAGEVAKVRNQTAAYISAKSVMGSSAMQDDVLREAAAPSRQSFGEHHLYTLPQPTDLAAGVQKQVALLSSPSVKLTKVFTYDALNIDHNPYRNWSAKSIAGDQNYGNHNTDRIHTTYEFLNDKSNNLAMPLPMGTFRLIKASADGAHQLLGEAQIGHTPKNEKVRLFLGNAFDLKGERKRIDFKSNYAGRTLSEAFEIKLTNRKDSAVMIRVVERLYRWSEWRVSENSQKFKKSNANTIEFDVLVPKNASKTVRYRANYSW